MSPCLFTGKLLVALVALLALHLAAPAELAVALPAPPDVLGIVAASAAEQVAAAGAMATPLADPTASALAARLQAAFAVVRRCLQVHQFHALGPVENRFLGTSGAGMLLSVRL